MYNHSWYKIVSQAMIDSLLRQYRRISNMNVDDVEAVSNNESL